MTRLARIILSVVLVTAVAAPAVAQEGTSAVIVVVGYGPVQTTLVQA